MQGSSTAFTNIFVGRKFNAEQPLPKAFFNIISNLANTEPQSEFTFPFQYSIISQTWQSLEPPSSIPGKDSHMPSLTFLLEI